ncbi:MAG: SPOR domain-containing protein [Bacteroidota bacterium]
MIPQYLSELLLRFETVILPGLGLFHLKNIPASIKGDNILPPGKILLFDPSVKNNDGVLGNYISEKNRISFFNACELILEYVENVQKLLKSGNEVVLEKIGVLIKDPSGNICFSADTSINYNIDSFGLTSITAVPFPKTQKEKENNAKIQTSGKKKKNHITAMWIIAFFVLVVAGITTVYFIKPDLFSRIGININSQKRNNSILIADKKSDNNPSENKGESVNQDDSIIKAVKANSVEISQTQQQGNVRYYIIAASFRIKGNADNYVIQLNSQGYKPESIFMPEKNLYVVSYDVYYVKTQAEQALAVIKTSGNQDAWILEK